MEGKLGLRVGLGVGRGIRFERSVQLESTVKGSG